MLLGTLPGVIVGAVARVFLLPGPQVFRLFAAAPLLPRLAMAATTATHRRTRAPRTVSRLRGDAGARRRRRWRIYGIGGGSLLSPILVGRGVPVAKVAPAALVSTFVTSIVGAVTYMVLAVLAPGENIAPDWTVGIAAGVGGLLGEYVGARLQPAQPDTVLRRLLGTLAIVAAALYVVQSAV